MFPMLVATTVPFAELSNPAAVKVSATSPIGVAPGGEAVGIGVGATVARGFEVGDGVNRGDAVGESNGFGVGVGELAKKLTMPRYWRPADVAIASITIIPMVK